MNKTELVAAVANKAGVSKKDAEKAVTALTETIISELANGNKVQIVGFGTFEARERAARKGINPLTKEAIDIKESVVPAFKAGQGFKNALK
jgi:DNA-binding protein HU-beta